MYKACYKKRSVNRGNGWAEFQEILTRRELNDLLRYIEKSDGYYVLVSIVPHIQKGENENG